MRPLPAVPAPLQAVGSPSLALLLAYFGAHALLGIAMKKAPALATVHALASLLVALFWAASAKGPGKVVTAICYLAGAEVLWRMTGARVFWEFGKYAVCGVVLVSLLRYRPPRFNGLALLYFGLLLPSTLLTCRALPDLALLSQALSSDLSGPLSLAICALYFFRMKLSTVDTSRLMLAVLGPVTGVAAVCTFGIANLDVGYEFGTESNFDASGGFGPNQVSAILGWGILMGFLWMQRHSRLSSHWWIGFVLVLYFAAQAALTFSRTGIWIALITVGTASIFMIRNPGKLLPSLLGTILVFGVFYFVIFQSLDGFTGGKLSSRYSEKGFSNREQIASADLRLALLNPILGVGPGMGKAERKKQFGVGGAPHTEFTRLLAEHGLAGLIALVTLLVMGVMAVGGRANPHQQAWTASLLAYSVLFMLVTGMRLVVPALTLGLAIVKFPGASQSIFSRRRITMGCRIGNRPHAPGNFKNQPSFLRTRYG